MRNNTLINLRSAEIDDNNINESIKEIEAIKCKIEWFNTIDKFNEDDLVTIKYKLEKIKVAKVFKKENEKLFNSFLLEVNRKCSSLTLANMNNENNKSAKVESELRRVALDFKNIKSEQAKITDEISKFHANTTTILSIFGAILIAFFSGVKLFDGALISLGNENIEVYDIALICIIVGVVIFNIIYMLISCIFKLLNKNLLHQKEEEIMNLKKLKKEAAIVYYFNLISGMVVVIITFTYILDRYNIPSFIISNIYLNYNISIVGVSILIVSILIGLIILLSKNLMSVKSIRKEVEEKEKNVQKMMDEMMKEKANPMGNVKEIFTIKEAANSLIEDTSIDTPT